jgi:3-dehydroquinate synthase II
VKELWIQIAQSIHATRKHELLKLATQVCDAILVCEQDLEEAKKTGAKVASNSDKSDIIVFSSFDEVDLKKAKRTGRAVAVKIEMKGRDAEKTAIKAAKLAADYIILYFEDWKVIPLENLIAETHGKSKLLAVVSNAREARLALETLELGADGVVLNSPSLAELRKTAVVAKRGALKLDLVQTKITRLTQLGTGARICVDTCDLMKQGEGFLVGSQSSGLFLVQAEVQQNKYVETRPFRVNAGPVSLYILSSPKRTRYLSELQAGDEVLVVDRNGETRSTNVARVKIEWRPMCLVEAECGQKKIKTIAQNAETVRFVMAEGSKSIAELKSGDKVLAHISKGGRHFGTLVEEETVIER